MSPSPSEERLAYPGVVGRGGGAARSASQHGERCQRATEENSQMTDALEFLARDHAEVKQMLAQLEIGAVRQGAATPGQLAERKKLAEQLVIEESRHEAIEEMYFWPAVREHLPNGDELADTAISQEEEGKEILDKLDKLDAGTPEFDRLLADFA